MLCPMHLLLQVHQKKIDLMDLERRVRDRKPDPRSGLPVLQGEEGSSRLEEVAAAAAGSRGELGRQLSTLPEKDEDRDSSDR